jgi:hypothetical protein
LKMANPLPAGKAVKCPKCSAVVTPVLQDQAAVAGAGSKPAAAQGAAGKSGAAAAVATAPTPPKPAGNSAGVAVAASKPAAPPAVQAKPKVAPAAAKPPASPTAGSADGQKPVPTSPSAQGITGQPAKPAKPAAAPAEAPKPAPTSPSAQGTHKQLAAPAQEGVTPQTVSQIHCSACKVTLKAPKPVPVGKTVKCPKCGQLIKVAAPAAVAAAAPSKPAPVNGVAAAPASPLSADSAADMIAAPPPEAEPPLAKVEDDDAANVSEQTAVQTPETMAATAEAEGEQQEAAQPKEKWTRKRKRILLIAAVALTIAGIGAGIYYFVTRPPYVHPIPAEDWKSFNPPGGHCQIWFPLPPGITEPEQVAIERQPWEPPGPLAKEFFVERKDKDPKLDVKFTIAYIELPPQSVTQREFEDGFQKRKLETLRSSKGKTRGDDLPLILSNHPGKEFQIEAPKGRLIRTRIYLVELPHYTRIYALMAEGPWAAARGNFPAAKFFDEFKVPPRGMGMAAKDPAMKAPPLPPGQFPKPPPPPGAKPPAPPKAPEPKIDKKPDDAKPTDNKAADPKAPENGKQ